MLNRRKGLKRTRLNRVSRKNSRKTRDNDMWDEYSKQYPDCQICPILREHRDNGWHPRMRVERNHIFGGSGGRVDLWENSISACGPCHDWCESNRDGRILYLSVKLDLGYPHWNPDGLQRASRKHVSQWLWENETDTDFVRPHWLKLMLAVNGVEPGECEGCGNSGMVDAEQRLCGDCRIEEPAE